MEYMAPEVERCPLKRGPWDNKEDAGLQYSTAADVWSLGALVYELLVGFPPFAAPDRPKPALPQAPAPGAVPSAPRAAHAHLDTRALAFPHNVSSLARDFIQACLKQHPGERPVAQALAGHAWISQQDRHAKVGWWLAVGGQCLWEGAEACTHIALRPSDMPHTG